MINNLKHNDISISEKNPFENCKLNRKPYANLLTKIVQNFSDGFVLAINNKWGTGKTTFVKMWKQYLENEGFKTLYFNAWENDFEKDVLVTLIAELENLKNDDNEKLFKDIVYKGIPIVKDFGKIALKSLIDKFMGDDFSKEILNTLTETIDCNLEDRINSYLNRKQSIESFKESLKIFVNKTTKEKPLIFMIDELDRCRPNYAVEVLEQIKHLFSVQGIVFVLSIDKEQLGHSVRGIYGSDKINAEEYLRRFIDIEYSIPEPKTGLFSKYLYQYYDFDNFFKSEARKEILIFKNTAEEFKNFCEIFFTAEKLTLRIQEKIFAQTRVSLSISTASDFISPNIYIYLIYLKLTNDKFYYKLKNIDLTYIDIMNELNLLNLLNLDRIAFLKLAATILLFYHNSYSFLNNNSELINNDGKLLIKTNLDLESEKKLSVYIERLSLNFSDFKITYYTDKIDLIDTITIG